MSDARKAVAYKRSRYTLTVGSGETAYLFNTLSGALMRMGPREQEGVALLFESLESTGSIPAGMQRVAGLLVENGFIAPCDADEVAEALRVYDERRMRRDQLSLTIATTMRCNMGCHYCFEDRTSTQALGAADAEAIARFAATRLQQGGSLAVNWFGGEPLLQMDFIRAATAALRKVAEGKNAGYSAGMTSNAYFLDRATVSELKDLRIVALQATLDGAQDQHDSVRRHLPETGGARIGSFERIVENLFAASETLAITLRVNVSRQNQAGIGSLLDHLAQAGFASRLRSIYFAPVFNYKVRTGRRYRPSSKVHFGSREFAELEASLVEKAASLGFRIRDWAKPSDGCVAVSANGFVIDSNGEVKKCDHHLGDSSAAVLALRDEPADAAPKPSVFETYRPESNAGCGTCALLPVCYSFCPNKHLEADIERAEKCPSHKYNWERTLPVLLSQRYERP